MHRTVNQEANRQRTNRFNQFFKASFACLLCLHGLDKKLSVVQNEVPQLPLPTASKSKCPPKNNENIRGGNRLGNTWPRSSSSNPLYCYSNAPVPHTSAF